MPCGIAGFVGLSEKDLLTNMLDVQRHRGPDHTGYFLDTNVGLGSDRLSIIDLDKGSQPVHNEDGSIWMVFNGEIYNYVELREILEANGHRFYTDSDTETIVHAYEQWGYSCLENLRGMFAFAIWDQKKGLLFAARDRFGKKPLYYYRHHDTAGNYPGDTFLFSSELKGILQFPEFRREIDFRALDHFFTYTYIPSPLTIFKGVFKLPPAHYLVYDGRSLEVREYWDLFFHPVEQDEGVAVESLYSIFKDAIGIRLRSDVPVGAFLSGGIDSSLVTSIMVRASKFPVRTVTVGFDEEDEHIRYGRLVSNFLKTDHKEYCVSSKSIEILPKLLWHFDEPFADPSLIPTYYVSQMTRAEVKVALTGEGGDEMFMGYPFLTDQPIYTLYKVLPNPVRRLGLSLFTHWPGETEFKKMADHALEKKYGEQDFFGRYMLRTVVFTPDTLNQLYSYNQLKDHKPVSTLDFLESRIKRPASISKDPLDAVDYVTIKGYLSEMILVKVDRMSMAVSLEARCPMLDHVLAEYVVTLSSNLKYRGSTTKYILKKLALEKSLLPKEVVSRKKLGFGAPVDRWMGSEWKDFSEQVLDKASGTRLFNRNYLNSLTRNRYVNSSKIFALTVFTLWHSQYMEQDPRKPLSLNKLL